MLISNGVKTRNIAEEQLAEYKRKGYAVVETPTTKAVETPKAVKTGKKTPAKPKASDK